ncbi:large extracellular alpha-helical protein [Saprospira grandis DSM 2844]|uniref:Large extracellular alpha-helical protein n=1 Tax=Saprospira grandis DSM 2844 TaxID=694433 RepID=J0P4E9_9BACT|nr:MG2 domain-containing protein [Saprospira grandis]EJF52302.1 large extracellular alpha-helical protein [Saprospira grandis DSM 2844]
MRQLISPLFWSSLLLSGFLLLGLSACSKKDKPPTDQELFQAADESYKNYISAYTAGLISAADPIRIRFSSDLASKAQIGQAAHAELLSFEPALKGKLFWEDAATLRFEPAENLPQKQSFRAILDLKKLFKKLPEGLENFKFAFKALPQDFEISSHRIYIPKANQADQLELEGALYTADVASPESVQQLLQIDYPGQENLELVWKHLADQRTHQFTIRNIQLKKGGEDGQLFLRWDGQALGLDKKGVDTINMPSELFKVAQVKVLNDESGYPYFSVQFSQPLAQYTRPSPNDNAILPNNSLRELDYLSIFQSDYEVSRRFDIFVEKNELKCIPRNKNTTGDFKLVLNEDLRSSSGDKLKGEQEFTLELRSAQPAVRLLGRGSILPNNKGLFLPFEAINLKAVDVQVVKIYENNVLQFLQKNDLNDLYLNYMGRVVAQKRVSLQELAPNANPNEWTRYALALDELVEQEPGAIYQVAIAFRKEYQAFGCGASASLGLESTQTLYQEDEESQELISFFERPEFYNYNYSRRNDPCTDDYYNYSRFVRRNLLASDIGMIAKRGPNKEILVALTDLRTTEPISRATVKIYDHFQQLMAELQTDSDGFAKTTTKYLPSLVVAEYNKQKGYLRMPKGGNLSLSRFEVGGSRSQSVKGLKGSLYGERGVWRPGDSLFLTVVLESKEEPLPMQYPLKLQLRNPRGQIVYSRTEGQHLNGVYSFKVKTEDNAPTGNWSAEVAAGGLNFSKRIMIETVKPNRLKIDLDLGKEELMAEDRALKADLKVKWLHGAPAAKIRSRVQMSLEPMPTDFEEYPDFVFDDPTRLNYSRSPFTVFDANLNEQGFAQLQGEIKMEALPAGKLRAGFNVRAFESGGDFSVDNFSMPFSPFTAYVGIEIPKDAGGRKTLKVKDGNTINLVVLDQNGQPLANRKVKVGLYRLDWRWWWDNGYENLSRFSSSYHKGAISTIELTTDAQGKALYQVTPEEWGRYMVRITEESSGHCTGDFFYAGSPWDDSDFGNRSAASMLAFSADKEVYAPGEEVVLQLPAGKTGRALLSLENSKKILEHRWIKIQDNPKGIQEIRFKVNGQMSPTIYAHISLVQPHQNSLNDLLIRSYGVIPIRVEDPASRLEPQLEMPSKLQPNSTVSIKVQEAKGRPMTYTIAMVDEGLLDLTRFKTPDLWPEFYKKEALGVKTWDLYEQVLGAFGQQLDRIITIGGGSGIDPAQAKKANRFKPMVRYLGPFELKAGAKAEHQVKIPNYIGSVRTMLVAVQDAAYGQAEKTTPVRKDLMTLASLPRVLSPKERLALPVTVFAMEKGIKDVEVRLETNELLQIKGEKSKKLRFEQVGEQMLSFDIEAAEGLGVAKIKVVAQAAGKTASYELEVQVRNPNPRISKTYAAVLQPGENWEESLARIGMPGTNRASLELSRIPALNLQKRLHYLKRYPYGCVEQTVSAVFAQLYLGSLMPLSKKETAEIEQNVKAAIKRLARFQTATGGFAYWPAGSEASEWGSSYAGHFLLAAKKEGYLVPKAMLDNWSNYQKSMSRIWRMPRGEQLNQRANAPLMQAYRLYTLALAGKSELAAMNLLRNQPLLPSNAKWRLAAAYALTGNSQLAKNMSKNLPKEVGSYREMSYTYGSDLRDEAMILETLNRLGQKTEAAKVLQQLAQKLSSDRWYSTQSTAYALLAAADFVKQQKGGAQAKNSYSFSFAQLNESASLEQAPIFETDLPVGSQAEALKVKNTGGGPLFVQVLLEGQALQDETEEISNDLKLTVNYQDLEGKKLDIKQIKQGTDFIAIVEVANPGQRGRYEELALEQVFPAGWEILSNRMNAALGAGNSRADYQDIRDDRVYSFFDLGAGQKMTFKIYLNAAYKGRFYLPHQSCEAMYDHSIFANKAGGWVEVN